MIKTVTYCLQYNFRILYVMFQVNLSDILSNFREPNSVSYILVEVEVRMFGDFRVGFIMGLAQHVLHKGNTHLTVTDKTLPYSVM